jgi:outer membrane protein OmpA-like peptidoglycan-associated protein
MKKRLIIALLIGGLNTTSWADSELQFATTEAQFVQALQQKPTNQRQRKGRNKGVRGIEKDDPKVGALIQFDFDSAVIKLESYSLLREFAKALQGAALSDATIKIVGHTDSIGTESYNFWLSKRRAEAVKNFLVSAYGIDKRRLMTTGYGEYQPIASNGTEAGQALNRRVEFVRTE